MRNVDNALESLKSAMQGAAQRYQVDFRAAPESKRGDGSRLSWLQQ
jgi:hypothetical protein